jgi:polar amino acid transport system substrate-binding protein
MTRPRSIAALPAALVLVAALLVAAGCGGDSDDSGDSEASANLEDCTPEELATLKQGTLTVATDDPAFPPYFEDNDPTNGRGFESAVAYAIADELGFEAADVDWVVEPFNSSYAPGPKDFDFDVNQISITPKRAEQVDFSSTYYTANQALVAAKDSAAADATSLDDLSDATIGVQIGTTSLDAVEAEIDPSEEPQVFNDSNDVGAEARPGGRGRDRSPDGAVSDRRAGARRKDRGPVRGAGRGRVGGAAGEGFAADRLRVGGDRRAQCVRRAGQDRE